MAIAFKLNSNGMVNVLIKPLSKKVTKDEFFSDSQILEFDRFVYRFKDLGVIETLIKEMDRLKRIDRLTINGPRLLPNEEGNYCLGGCQVGKLYFSRFYTDSKVQEKAIEYGYKYYGKQKMQERLHKIA